MSGQEERQAAGEFDFIIVGGGAAGGLLANRLSADLANRVLLLELGGSDIWFHIPVGYLFLIGNPRLELLLFRRGPLTMAPSQLGLFTKSDPRFSTANVQFHVRPLSLDKFGETRHPFGSFTASVSNLRPTSRGAVRLASPDPLAPPEIDPNDLSTDEDRRVAVDSLRLVRRIMGQPALQRFKPEKFRPGRAPHSDEEIGTTIFHPVGTARMGLADDPMAAELLLSADRKALAT
ncbi:MAG: GMC family oxidoreductase N-terminal domain-containing protein [Methylobacterium sp.]|nr:GMC family oxidoreductase N-terminal domain-containing protein [Methylobacterium sp.]MCA3655810.1 GMC family oxidoreductase N-terminal domain-containing protein [Methylobacterium sp.]MCA3659584.1 GMC family oxidoreductase N-terminal domain-containing protein [Methylobacterium sp.]MCA3662212.1 GMC family oxidoreductase N-terminal domain-containing protein [Methylobacterium sp.]MCA3663805.1 GMC family oxidoreductase N-terminal domain-containing protein [Methylobacterium sp.]